MGYLIDCIVERISEEILALADIPEVESGRLNELLKSLHVLEQVFVLAPSEVSFHLQYNRVIKLISSRRQLWLRPHTGSSFVIFQNCYKRALWTLPTCTRRGRWWTLGQTNWSPSSRPCLRTARSGTRRSSRSSAAPMQAPPLHDMHNCASCCWPRGGSDAHTSRPSYHLYSVPAVTGPSPRSGRSADHANPLLPTSKAVSSRWK